MHYLIEQNILPIMDGIDSVGQGFFADGYFITAAHVVKDFPNCYIKLAGNEIRLIRETPILQGERDIWNDETQHDVVMYRFDGIPSSLHLSARRVTFDDTLKSYCLFPKFDNKTNTYYNDLSVEKVVLKNQGTANYLWCECQRYKGSSGSPLLIYNEVVGIMHSGNDKGLCTFLKVRSFLLPPNRLVEKRPKDNKAGYNMTDYDPYGHYNHDAEARKQLGDAFEDEPGATWGRID